MNRTLMIASILFSTCAAAENITPPQDQPRMETEDTCPSGTIKDLGELAKNECWRITGVEERQLIKSLPSLEKQSGVLAYAPRTKSALYVDTNFMSADAIEEDSDFDLFCKSNDRITIYKFDTYNVPPWEYSPIPWTLSEQEEKQADDLLARHRQFEDGLPESDDVKNYLVLYYYFSSVQPRGTLTFRSVLGEKATLVEMEVRDSLRDDFLANQRWRGENSIDPVSENDIENTTKNYSFLIEKFLLQYHSLDANAFFPFANARSAELSFYPVRK